MQGVEHIALQLGYENSSPFGTVFNRTRGTLCIPRGHFLIGFFLSEGPFNYCDNKTG